MLLEALVALAILSAVIVALLTATGGQIRTAAEANGLVTAQALADDRLTTFRLLDYEGLAATPDSLRRGAFPPPLQEWSWEALVIEEPYDLFRVGVTVLGPDTRFALETAIHRARPVISGSGGRE